MKAIVITPFVDKNDRTKYYDVGQAVEFEKERFEELVKRGLIKAETNKQDKDA